MIWRGHYKKDVLAWLEKQSEQSVEPKWCHHKVDLSDDCSELYRKAYYDGWNNCNMQHPQCEFESNDKDEQIRKELMDFIYVTCFPVKDLKKKERFLDWLEKQDKQEPIPITDEWIEDYWQHEKVINPYSYDKGEEIQFDHQGFVNFCKKYCKKPVERNKEDMKIRKELIAHFRNTRCVTEEGAEKIAQWVAWLENQGVQTHAELGQSEVTNDQEFKPKFMVGNWLQYRNAKPFFVEEVTKQGYVNGDSCLPFSWENEIHLWTIADAKDGDLLAASDNSIFIYAGTDGSNAKFYIALTTCGTFNFGGGCWEDKDGVRPVTEEEYKTFFEKLEDKGLEWDQENKCLHYMASC